MYCENCGKKIEDSSRFCQHCGVLIGYTIQREESASEKTQSELYRDESRMGQTERQPDEMMNRTEAQPDGMMDRAETQPDRMMNRTEAQPDGMMDRAERQPDRMMGEQDMTSALSEEERMYRSVASSFQQWEDDVESRHRKKVTIVLAGVIGGVSLLLLIVLSLIGGYYKSRSRAGFDKWKTEYGDKSRDYDSEDNDSDYYDSDDFDIDDFEPDLEDEFGIEGAGDLF